MASPHQNRIQIKCFICKKPFGIIKSQRNRRPNACCSLECRNQVFKKIYFRENNPSWRGGRRIDKRNGYIYILTDRKKYRAEHRLILEKHLGKTLPPNIHVHHKNGIKSDNRLENLEALTPQEHIKQHPLRTWGKGGFNKCINCDKSIFPHKSRGMCSRCYESKRVR